MAQDALLEVEEAEVTSRAQVSGQLNLASDPVSCGAGSGPGRVGRQVELLLLLPDNLPTGR